MLGATGDGQSDTHSLNKRRSRDDVLVKGADTRRADNIEESLQQISTPIDQPDSDLAFNGESLLQEKSCAAAITCTSNVREALLGQTVEQEEGDVLPDEHELNEWFKSIDIGSSSSPHAPFTLDITNITSTNISPPFFDPFATSHKSTEGPPSCHLSHFPAESAKTPSDACSFTDIRITDIRSCLSIATTRSEAASICSSTTIKPNIPLSILSATSTRGGKLQKRRQIVPVKTPSFPFFSTL
jgi:hypothetical protein